MKVRLIIGAQAAYACIKTEKNIARNLADDEKIATQAPVERLGLFYRSCCSLDV